MAANDHYLQAMAKRLCQQLSSDRTLEYEGIQTTAVANYLSPERADAERRSVFGHAPLIVAHIDELPETGSYLTTRLKDKPLLLTKAADGKVHAFLNSCRHRGMPLAETGTQGCKRKLICPYHGWTYELDGQLRGISHEREFPGIDKANHNLATLPLEVRHGLIWVWPSEAVQAGRSIAEWLATLDNDFSHFDLSNHTVFRQVESVHNANWKLLIDAFLEAYHVRVLHRKTVGPFFHNSIASSEPVELHTRSSVARLELTADSIDSGPLDFRNHMTFTHMVFPNQVFVFHPDYVSQMSITPIGAEQFRWQHRMLVPKEEAESRKAHFDKSFDLIENGVFQSEDIYACEAIHASLKTGANEHVTFGQMEYLAGLFHSNIERLIQQNTP